MNSAHEVFEEPAEMVEFGPGRAIDVMNHDPADSEVGSGVGSDLVPRYAVVFLCATDGGQLVRKLRVVELRDQFDVGTQLLVIGGRFEGDPGRPGRLQNLVVDVVELAVVGDYAVGSGLSAHRLDAQVLLGCRKGGRAERAVELVGERVREESGGKDAADRLIAFWRDCEVTACPGLRAPAERVTANVPPLRLVGGEVTPRRKVIGVELNSFATLLCVAFCKLSPGALARGRRLRLVGDAGRVLSGEEGWRRRDLGPYPNG